MLEFLGHTRRMDDDSWKFFTLFRKSYGKRWFKTFPYWPAITTFCLYVANAFFVAFLALLLYGFEVDAKSLSQSQTPTTGSYNGEEEDQS